MAIISVLKVYHVVTHACSHVHCMTFPLMWLSGAKTDTKLVFSSNPETIDLYIIQSNAQFETAMIEHNNNNARAENR